MYVHHLVCWLNDSTIKKKQYFMIGHEAGNLRIKSALPFIRQNKHESHNNVWCDVMIYVVLKPASL